MTSTSNSSARLANASMFASRSALPVRSVIARSATGPTNRNAGMAGRVAVAVAGRSGGAGFAKAPGRAVPFAHAPRQQQRIGFRRRPQALHLGVADAEQAPRATLWCRPPRRRESRPRRPAPPARLPRQARRSRISAMAIVSRRAISRCAIVSASGNSAFINHLSRFGRAREKRRYRRLEIVQPTARRRLPRRSW